MYKSFDIDNGVVEMNHGGGGRAMRKLIDELFIYYLNNEWLAQGNDGAVVPSHRGNLVITTDAHVVSPLFFPGGDIGSLAVYGTVNDLAVMGAIPYYLAAGFIIEEGFPLAQLARIVESMAHAANRAQIKLVAGDTKIVERGKGDGLFITTTGCGFVAEGIHLSGDQARPGDVVLLSGAIGAHGLAILTQRDPSIFTAPIYSDSAPLNDLTSAMLMSGAELRLMRDPTRGGLAATLNEIAQQSHVGIFLNEESIPIPPEVNAACELLGIDPLNIANEGKLVAICAPNDAEKLLSIMRQHPLGQQAMIIGKVVTDENYFVRMQTLFGGQRMVDWLFGEQLPRIC